MYSTYVVRREIEGFDSKKMLATGFDDDGNVGDGKGVGDDKCFGVDKSDGDNRQIASNKNKVSGPFQHNILGAG